MNKVIIALIIGLFFFIFSGAMLVVTTTVWNNLLPKERAGFLFLIISGLGVAIYNFVKAFTFMP
jgi:hypothetical protein